MILNNVNVYRYDLPLKRPLFLNGEEHHTRNGLILKITNADGVFGLGEIAPLPGFSEETLEEATQNLFKYLAEYKEKPLPNNIGGISQKYSPSVAYGIETALVSLSANAKQFSFSGLVNRDSPRYVPINGLLWGENKDILHRAEYLIEQGYKSFKLKIGRQTFDDDIKLIEQLKKLIGDNISLRLDANRSYSYDDACRMLEIGKKNNIEYIEEPFENHEDLIKYLEIGKHCKLIGLDESLRQFKSKYYLKQLPNLERAGAMVLKPTMTGYIESMGFAMTGIKSNMKVVISSSFESAYGIFLLASIAAITNGQFSNCPAGLDTYDWFEENLFDLSEFITDGQFDLSSALEIYKLIDWSKLKEIKHA